MDTSHLFKNIRAALNAYKEKHGHVQTAACIGASPEQLDEILDESKAIGMSRVLYVATFFRASLGEMCTEGWGPRTPRHVPNLRMIEE